MKVGSVGTAGKLSIFVLVAFSLCLSISLLYHPVSSESSGVGSYIVSDAIVGDNHAKKITFPELSKSYNLNDEADKLGKNPNELLSVKLTEYSGNAVVKLKMKRSVEKQSAVPYNCNCGNVTVSERTTSSQPGNETDEVVSRQVERCGTCYNYESYHVDEISDVSPGTDVIGPDTEIYEVFEGCSSFSNIPGGWGCKAWSDVSILGTYIEGATWWNETYTYRKDLKIENQNTNATANIQTTSVFMDTQTLVSHGKIQSDCDDLRLTFNDTQIDRIIENCNTANTTILLKLQRTIAAETNDTLYSMYYGNPAAPAGPSNVTNVYMQPVDENTVFSLWMEEPSGGIIDHSPNKINFSVFGNPAYQTSGSGIIGYGLDLDGSGDYIDAMNISKMNAHGSELNDGGTLEFSVYQDVKTSTDYILSASNSTSPYNFILLNPDGYNDWRFQCGGYDDANVIGGMTSGAWHNVTIKWNSTGCYFYDNGEYKAMVLNRLNFTAFDHLYFGRYAGAEGYEFNGKIDEVRLSSNYREINKYERVSEETSNLSIILSEEYRGCPEHDTFFNENVVFYPGSLFCNAEDYGDGVIIPNSSNIIIDCNGMTLNGTHSGVGVSLSNYYLENVTVKNCTISNYQIGIEVMLFADYGGNNKIYNNTISNNEIGLRFHDLWINESVYHFVTDNNISNNNEAGVYIMNSGNIIFLNNVIKSNSEYDVKIKNDVAFNDSINNIFTNTTYDTEYFDVTQGSAEILRKWYLRINATDGLGIPLAGSNITVYNSSNDLIWSESADYSGLTSWHEMMQYRTVNESGFYNVTNYNPYNVSAYYSVYFNNMSNVINLTESLTYNIVMNKIITFNVTSGEDGSQLNNVDIECNYSGFNQNGDTTNTYGPYEFPVGDWSCKFVKKPGFYNKTETFAADSDKTLNIKMSKELSLTLEEHTWLEWLYECWNSGDCFDLMERIGLQTTEINQTTGKIWNQYKRTDQTIVTKELITSPVVNSTSNLTIEYNVNVPVKEGYGVVSGIQGYDDFLPIRINYWFLDSTNKSCYSQGNYSVGLAEPYCQPMTIYTVGQINTQLNFTVDLRPDLPAGNYTIVRDIEIDPENVWIDYGHEIIGQMEITGNFGGYSANVRSIGRISPGEETSTENTKSDVKTELAESSGETPGTTATGMYSAKEYSDGNSNAISYMALLVSMVTLVMVGLLYSNSRKMAR